MSAPRRLQPWKICLWVGGLLAVLLTAAWLTLYAVGSARLARALSDLKEAGYAISLEELAPPPVPEERNGASSFRAASARVPDPGDAGPALDRAELDGFAALTEEEKAAVRGYLGRAHAFFSAARDGRRRGACRYERDYALGLAMEFPELQGASRAIRLLSVRMQAETDAGRAGEAQETLRDMVALAEGYRSEPVLILQLVRWGLLASAVEAVHRGVGASSGEEELRGWLDALPPAETLDGAAVLALRGELAAGAPLAGRSLQDAYPGSDFGPAGSSLFVPVWKLSGARYLGAMRRLVEASEKPYLQARTEAEAILAEIEGKRDVFDVMSILLMPALGRVLDNAAQAKAAVVLARTGLAAEIERAATGRYPERIDVPDPLSDKPFIYRKGEGRILSHGVPGKPATDPLLEWKLRRAGSEEK